MMKIYTSLFIAVCALLSIQSPALADGLTWRYDNSSRSYLLRATGAGCSVATQIACSGCDRSVYCVAIGADFIEADLETCRDGQTCIPGKGCSTDPNPEPDCAAAAAPTRVFPCSSVGVFPDPADCKAFHFCPPAAPADDTRAAYEQAAPVEYSTEGRCERGYGYDAHSALCRVKLEGDECPQRAKLCNGPGARIGDNGALTAGSSYFYICQKRPGSPDLYPFVYRCPHGEMYSHGKCYEPEMSMIPAECENPQTTEQPGSSTPDTGSQDFQCPGSGSYANLDNCRSYFHCQREGSKPLSFTCSSGQYFDKDSGRCRRGTCDDE